MDLNEQFALSDLLCDLPDKVVDVLKYGAKAIIEIERECPCTFTVDELNAAQDVVDAIELVRV